MPAWFGVDGFAKNAAATRGRNVSGFIISREQIAYARNYTAGLPRVSTVVDPRTEKYIFRNSMGPALQAVPENALLGITRRSLKESP